jgi:hypothetical protein
MPGEVNECGICGSADLIPLLDMGIQPLPESLGPSRRYPLNLVRCLVCSLVQLDFIPDQKQVFRRDHPYSTGNSAALRLHYRDLAAEIAGYAGPGELVIDIGANDGTLLDAVPPGRCRLAVEPTDQGKRIPGAVTWYREFFTKDLAARIREKHGPARVVTACNVLAHVPDPHDFTAGVRVLLDDDGTFITENHDLASVTDGLQIDTVYHEHLRYYSPATLAFLLERHGFHVTSVQPTDTHGGSFRTTARMYKPDFPHRARVAATALRAMLWKIAVAEKKVIYGIGAATRATPLVYFSGIDGYISLVCEVHGSDKIGHCLPGTQVKVVDESRLYEDQPPYALLFAWHMADHIIPKLREAGYTGRFIVPLPEPRVLDY